MMKCYRKLSLSAVLMLGISGSFCLFAGVPENKALRQIADYYERGMYSRALAEIEAMDSPEDDAEAAGYRALCAIRLQSPGYEVLESEFSSRFPSSRLADEIHYRYALNVFDLPDYARASGEFAKVNRKALSRKDLPEFLYKRAYCDFENGMTARAFERFAEVEKLPLSSFTAPSRYCLGYMNYEKSDFAEALKWFEKSVKDQRFKDISSCYILECRFMLKDYDYVRSNGPETVESAPLERKQHMARFVSEAFLLDGRLEEAEKYYQLADIKAGSKSDADLFYAGSLLYGIKDWQGAVDNYSLIRERNNSNGQVAAYNSGFAYVQLKNKTAALNAFQEASKTSFDPAIAEDAMFNHAKLAFDLNSDGGIFREFLRKYPKPGRDEQIWSYIAVACLRNRDYDGAIQAYDEIDELDGNMKGNYMKANYLRAAELIGSESYTLAIPYLKTATYFSDKSDNINQLARLWLAESYFNTGSYAQARELYRELDNMLALNGLPEGKVYPYGIAYTYFKEGDYEKAAEWFDTYLRNGNPAYGKDAMTRRADCSFMSRDYAAAASEYTRVAEQWADPQDAYPYYQAGLSYGLDGKEALKIEVLEKAAAGPVKALYYPEAMLELGRAYVKAGRTAKAAETFEALSVDSADETYVAKALMELAMLARNSKHEDEALDYYKQVACMPKSGYSEDALLAVETIYKSRGEAKAYLEWLEGIGKASSKTSFEKEDLIFNSAEQTYIGGNWSKAFTAFADFMDTYPSSSRLADALFYEGECCRMMGRKEDACNYYRRSVETEGGSYREQAFSSLSSLEYSLQMWDRAFEAYSSLYDEARMDQNKSAAVLGMVRSAYAAKRWDDVIAKAVVAEGEKAAGAAVKRETSFRRAKAHLSLSQREQAYDIFSKLAQDPSSQEGSESAYLVILNEFDSANYKKVESLVYTLSDKGTADVYWLAKSFIVLGDSFAERGELEQAQATFQSVKDGYKPQSEDDDVLESVEFRLNRLNEMKN
ncbi:MAG: tetratricopeptide repeat protein [Bacteroidales bacterium]|nr:tetratricopeptide repeat protein [Bacteroidales bacterium]